jgi:4-hydroxybenzoate polyprenyltransferase
VEAVVGPTALPYLLHLRPLEWPIMTAHFLLGTLLAMGLKLSWGMVLLGWFAYVVLLNGGTLAINSAFDQDEGDIGYLRQPPKPPRYLLHFSSVLLLLGVVSALPFFAVAPQGNRFFWILLLCTVMSVLYSVPPIRLKARAGWDLLINCLGFGMLTPLAGWAATGRPFPPFLLYLGWGFFFLFAALYPLTQIYQVEEDRSRGDRTLVILMGEGRALGLALAAVVVAHACFAGSVLVAQRNVLVVLLSLAAWLGVVVPWMARWRAMSPAQHEAGMYRGLAAWAVTDISLLILLWPR